METDVPEMAISAQEHWNSIYQAKQRDAVSWYAPHLNRSLAFIAEAAPNRHSGIIDVGAGQSTLVDDLLDRGYCNLSLLDISDAALAATRARLGERGNQVRWYAGDVTSVALPENGFDLWHDRAVFHFLLEPEQRAAYAAQARRSIKRGGHAVIATFAENGPSKCSGLPVARYTPLALASELGDGFELLDHAHEEHATPAGAMQKFVYCLFRRI